MRLLSRNKQTVWYSTYVSKTPILDEYGNDTGQSLITYSSPVKTDWNVGYIESEAEVEAFGIAARDTLRIAAEKDGFPLDEASIIWFNAEPTSPFVVTDPHHTHRIAGIRPSLNELVFYAVKVDVS